MAAVDRLRALLPVDAARLLASCADEVSEIRLRSGQRPQLVGAFGERFSEEMVDGPALRRILAALMDFSLYARQHELDQGFFTLDDGSRVGVCGHVCAEGGQARMGDIGSICIRVARPLPGCADSLIKEALSPTGPRSMLIVSPPGMGKTTILRDLARQISLAGYCVGIADERHELAACRDGAPTLDVGPRTDVMDGCDRPQAIRRMLRSMAPRLIVADEVGGMGDALALADAARCGVAIVATAHAHSFSAAFSRPALRGFLDSGGARRAALLGPRPGEIREIWRRDDAGEGESAWRRA